MDTQIAIHAFEDLAIDVGLGVALSGRFLRGNVCRTARRQPQEQKRQQAVSHFLEFVEQLLDPLELSRKFHFAVVGSRSSEAAMLPELNNLPGHENTRL
ncbi:MAG: hypothetical protein ISP45_03870 [Reyranella sp.]|nr:hypothetical protein [Reyranella sp.]